MPASRSLSTIINGGLANSSSGVEVSVERTDCRPMSLLRSLGIWLREVSISPILVVYGESLLGEEVRRSNKNKDI
jgi:hypothetical protein